MTKTELKYNVQDTGSKYFDRSTMQFFGDTMKNYGVRLNRIDTYTEKNVKVWELYRIRPVRNNLRSSSYFNTNTFDREHAKI